MNTSAQEPLTNPVDRTRFAGVPHTGTTQSFTNFWRAARSLSRSIPRGVFALLKHAIVGICPLSKAARTMPRFFIPYLLREKPASLPYRPSQGKELGNSALRWPGRLKSPGPRSVGQGRIGLPLRSKPFSPPFSQDPIVD